MKILLIEDDGFKSESIVNFIELFYPNAALHLCSSLSEGIEYVNKNIYDYVLVDMAIPSHPIEPGGGSPLSLLTGGLEIILELKFLERKDSCIIITQYPDLELCGQLFSLDEAVEELRVQLECNVLACIEYNEGSEQWKKKLRMVLK
ncbi:response regulator [Citrobacter koseri]|nr:response regulator [Citrobacter koseri]HBC5385551.1 response regulator [Citrobacter koseri]HCR9761463.1 response regulator [Citrobacter koseri]HEM8492122.1 response regulator [Citrobacter koseri]